MNYFVEYIRDKIRDDGLVTHSIRIFSPVPRTSSSVLISHCLDLESGIRGPQ